MMRYRRYRVFLVFAIVSVFVLYRFASKDRWAQAQAIGSGFGFSKSDKSVPHPNAVPEAAPVDSHHKPQVQDAGVKVQTSQTSKSTTPPAVLATSRIAADLVAPVSTSSPAPVVEVPSSEAPQPTLHHVPISGNFHVDDVIEVGQGRLEVSVFPTQDVIRWSKQTEHFPVATTIQLPTGTPKTLPRIQHKFSKETAEQKAAREQKLDAITKAASHAWKGYREHGWMHDEVSPVSGGYRDPFCGWSATLVDALDTLWIIGLKDEFEDAVKAVGKIDFKTSQRKDIPLFETTIRYLGGMLAAYDVSGAKYRILLDKAVELAEVLMGAFDTPNRMPDTYYHWMPTFASQPHRASSRVVLAEIGSLSMEFTRLAQLTKEPKYYDAVARITNAFAEWQSRPENGTLIPGLWPTFVDASGCEKPAQIHTPTKQVPLGDGTHALSHNPQDPAGGPGTPKQYNPAAPGESKEDKGPHSPGEPKQYANQAGQPAQRDVAAENIRKRQLESDLGANARKELDAAIAQMKPPSVPASNIPAKHQVDQQTPPPPPPPMMAEPDEEICIDRGLDSPSKFGQDTFTMGGMADSTYEYLTKEYILLGGLEPVYKTMYEKVADACTKHLLYRPMLPNNENILFAGYSRINWESNEPPFFVAEGAHLSCFIGGMYALGAKIFNRDQDLTIAAKLTMGCVWAYRSTPTGIMPEAFDLLPCESTKNCKWNQTAYNLALDPYADSRGQVQVPEVIANAVSTEPKSVPVENPPAAVAPAGLKRRQEAAVQAAAPVQAAPVQAAPVAAPVVAAPPVAAPPVVAAPVQADPVVAAPVQAADQSSHDMEHYQPDQAEPAPAPMWTPPPPPTHQEYVAAKIAEERLPPGFVRLNSRKYILRPEAIESVFYMYRITGDEHWREVGWDMFQAVQKHTYATYGNSAIDDVTKTAPDLIDEEESFWLAETVKYFYLLFAKEDVISLDDWVLNTEAHPFRRPDSSV